MIYDKEHCQQLIRQMNDGIDKVMEKIVKEIEDMDFENADKYDDMIAHVNNMIIKAEQIRKTINLHTFE